MSKRLFFNEPGTFYYSYIVDSLVLVKCFLRQDKIQLAQDTLDQSWTILMKFYTNGNYKVTEDDIFIQDGKELTKIDQYIRRLSGRTGGNSKKKNNFEAMENERLKIRKNLLIIKEIKKRTSLLSTFATLFNALGNFKACESCYVHYLKLIQVNYGKRSLESSNCFFLMGIFYLTSSSPTSPHLKKAISCFMASLKIRTKVLPETHTSVSDCYYNIGIVLFLARNSNETVKQHLDSIESSARNHGFSIIDSGTLVERSLN